MHLGEEGYVSVHYALVNDDGEEEPRYGLADEAGKININKATFDVLKQFFEVTGQMTSPDGQRHCRFDPGLGG